jgi:hypothetical protein
MDCRTFRRKHVAFVDDTLPGVDLGAMLEHVARCTNCATLDAKVRRGLLVFRNNVPSIEPSAEFSRRLEQRLEAERKRMAAPPPVFRGPPLAGFLAASAGVVAIGVLAILAMQSVLPSRPPLVAGVVLRPSPRQMAVETSMTISSPAFVASVSTGMAMWPALLLAEEAPVRYASDATPTPAMNAVNYSATASSR